MKHPLPKPQSKQDVPQQPQKVKVKTHASSISKGRNHSRKETTASRPPLAPSTRERISNGVEVAMQKPAPHVFDLNQNARSFSGKDASFHGSAAPSPMLDLNQKDRIHSGKEATKKSITPFFDLNQISVINCATCVDMLLSCLSHF